MKILPAIDIINGQCVRLKQGDYNQKTVYHQDPLKVAKGFADQGADIIHLVDLDGAKAKEPKNLELAIKIAQTIDVPVELGGGIRTLSTVEKALEAGIARVILGTVALSKPDWLLTAVKRYGERIVVGIDARDGLVAVEGWQETSHKTALALALEMKELGVAEIIYTDISRDGMLQGPNLAGMREICKSGLKVVASGGVSTYQDIVELKKLESHGVVGAIIGKALYTGDIQVAKAVELAREEL